MERTWVALLKLTKSKTQRMTNFTAITSTEELKSIIGGKMFHNLGRLLM